MTDAEGGSRRGLFFKTANLLRAIQALIMAEMTPDLLACASADALQASHSDAPKKPDQVGVSVLEQGSLVQDDAMLSLSDEPWLRDIWGSSWDSISKDMFSPPYLNL
ncbi:hypothetical protein PG990_014072 [Apiospora arundinis]